VDEDDVPTVDPRAAESISDFVSRNMVTIPNVCENGSALQQAFSPDEVLNEKVANDA
jgi:hypothetical protein